MTGTRSFGVSTHLYHGQRLSRDHLIEIGTHGFDAVDLVATRTHFDYHNPASVADLQQWLAEARLTLHGVHMPVGERFINGRVLNRFSVASPDPERRAVTVAEARQALQVARRIPFDLFIVHAGVPRSEAAPAENSRDAVRRSVEELQAIATPLGVRVALEVFPNELSRPGALAYLIERVLDSADVTICLDVGHAHLEGDVIDAIEAVSEHLAAVEVHDNRGRHDDHLLPFEGTVDWPAVLTTIQKVGYDGALILEIAAKGSTKETLAKAQQARQRMERLLAM